MKRLRRAYKRQNSKRSKFRKRAIAAGTAAAITLGAGAGLNKAVAKDKPGVISHKLPVALDADADLLTDAEETAIGYRPFITDQDRNEVADGVDLALHCAAVINELPAYYPDTSMPIPNQTHKVVRSLFGIETCDICGQEVNREAP